MGEHGDRQDVSAPFRKSLTTPTVRRPGVAGRRPRLPGATTPEFPVDRNFSGSSNTVSAPFRVLLGNDAIVPSVAALVAPGLYQVRIAVPPGIASGDHPIQLDFGTVQSAKAVYLKIQP
jgi:hypothetical protein